MKKLRAICFLVFFVAAVTGTAQTQTITLTATNGLPSSFSCTTNQVITIKSFISSTPFSAFAGTANISFYNGINVQINSYNYGIQTANGGLTFAGNAEFTGVTNILVTDNFPPYVAALTFSVTTPSVQSSIPANAVVIPSDAAGPVQIVLESSSDLVNWTSSLPGTYGNTYSNRFFRVRAIAQ